ncbi:TonB-dependent receptor family protein [Tenacibaculum agarivorans]|uniref:TonB-dependent receptor family protein n=1 Tax=Tenacibaculum agarivorans TaxID=1908389 RepID=UPI00094BB26D|nr:TonB-dependent receptor [Tenacibaculum agarivorans]
MKSYIFYFVFFIFCKCYAQLKGKVLNTLNEPIAYANVILFNSKDKSVVKGIITNEEGDFEIHTVNSGNYFLKVDLLTYNSWQSKVFIYKLNEEKIFPKIILKESSELLDEVTINSTKKLIKNTREGNILNVQESILTKGSSVLQLLERSPGVILDQRNNSFSLNGKSNTTIMINGKVIRIPTSEIISMLNGMSADTIEKIELLTNPSSRYDADGNAGIINIVTSKNENIGFKGSTNISLGYGTGEKQTTSLSLNYGEEKISTYGSYSFSYDDTLDGWRGVGSTNIPVFNGVTFIDFSSKTTRINRSHNLNLGLDYQINTSKILGASFLFNASSPNINTNNLGLYNFQVNPFLDARIHLNANGNWKNYNVSSFFETSFNKSTLTTTVDYIHYNNQTPNFVKSLYFDENGQSFQPDGDIYNTGNRGTNETNINIGVVKLDYKKNINEKFTFETGVKGSASKTINKAKIEIEQNGIFVSDDRFINDLESEEQIGAVYTQGNYDINDKYNLQIGFRYEYWNQVFDDTSLNRSFGKIFPSIFLTKKISDTKNWNLAYTKRITRPNYVDLASYLTYNSPTSVFTGNPQLLPAITNSLNFTFNYKSYNFSLIGTLEDSPIAYYQVTEDSRSDLAIIAPQNLEFQNSLDFQTNIPLRITNWWNMNFNGTIGYRTFKLQHTPIPTVNDYIHYNFNGSQSFKVNDKLSLELSGWYTSNHFNGSSEVSGFGALNAGIKKSFKNGSNIQFSVTDILQSIIIEATIGSLTQEAYDNFFSVNYQPESTRASIFRLSYTYSFGNSKIKEGSSRTGAGDENSRIQN